jgi:NhaA family Na+:H+ antiporter
VLPLFVFTVAGVSFHEFRASDLLRPAPLAVLAALAIGKPAGILGACAAAISCKLARRPTGASWSELAGVALVCGAGFTVSFYVAGQTQAGAAGAALRAAILLGSVLPALAGGGLLAWSQAERAQDGERQPALG